MVEAIKSMLLGMAAIFVTILGAILMLWAVVAWAKSGFPLPGWSLWVILATFCLSGWVIGSEIRKSMRQGLGRPSDG